MAEIRTRILFAQNDDQSCESSSGGILKYTWEDAVIQLPDNYYVISTPENNCEVILPNGGSYVLKIDFHKYYKSGYDLEYFVKDSKP